jgi:putative oxidoreductase
MQRFFSTFPNGGPGTGLLILRLALSGGLFTDAVTGLPGVALSQAIPAAAEILMGVLIIVGLWTPIVAIVVCLLQLGIALMADRTLELQLLTAAVGVSLALLGPGAWSIDARLFGRRRVEIKHLRDE